MSYLVLPLSRPLRSDREIALLLSMAIRDKALPTFLIGRDRKSLSLQPGTTREQVRALIQVLVHTGLLDLENIDTLTRRVAA